MLLTVIIVTKNPGNDIYPTLSSLRYLDDPSVEILIKDNSSDRQVEEVSKSFSFSNLRYVHQKDDGVYDAMNQAIELAQGKFLYFLNAGDQYLDCNLLDTLKTDREGIDFYYGNMIFLSPFTRLVQYSSFINKYSVYLRRVCHQAVVFRKDVFDTLGDFDTKLKIEADYLFIVRMMDKFKGESLNSFIALYKGGGLSSGHKSSKEEKVYLRKRMKDVFSTPELWILSFASVFVAVLVFFKNLNKPK